MAHEHHHFDIDHVQEQFSFGGKLQKNVMVIGVIGLLLFVAGVLMAAFGGHHEAHAPAAEAAHAAAAHAADAHAAAGGHAAEAGHGHHYHWTDRVIANFWVNGVFFTGVALLGLFFYAVQLVANAGWSVPVQRVMLNYSRFIPFGGLVLLATFLIGGHSLFHWTDASLYDPALPSYDKILDGKKAFLNVPFFLTRMGIFLTVWTLFGFLLRSVSYNEDLHKGSTEHFRKAQRIAVGFLIFFGVSESITAWDWIMSIDPHWYSTLFAWYCLASWLVTAVASITLVVMILREMGYLKIVNENHLHDLGKFIFGFSVFWSYLWIAQFLLIYYANIPEETIYFMERLRMPAYKPLFFANILLNFFVPFLVLMTRDAKRKHIMLKIAIVVVMIGHWLDFYLMITPGSLKDNGGIGLMEIGLPLVFLSAFALVLFKGLAKKGLIAQNHPMLEEGLYHHT